MTLLDNYNRIRTTIRSICDKTGRDPASVLLLPVSKSFPVATLQQAIDSGITLFGENKVQEARTKNTTLKGNCSFHMIGHLQSNKAADAVEIFDCIHSIDKLSTAQKVHNAAKARGKTQRIFLQINTTGETSKSGAPPETICELGTAVDSLDALSLDGLMTIGPLTGERDEIRRAFIRLRELKETLSIELGRELPHLSMGMSGDFDIAIEEGATIVRIGSAIFGQRAYQ